jgi:uncharacterized membrane protein YdjX (TVP38/TMEM64 family)
MNKRLLLAGSGWLILFGLVLSLGLIWGPELWALLRNEERLREVVNSFGLLGPLVFIGLQFLQVVIFVIPGEVVQVAGGYIYGPWLGVVYSLIGIALGSASDFFIARALGRPFVEVYIRKETVGKFDGAISGSGGLAALFFLFLLPGTPKDALCYIGGLSTISFPLFLLVSLFGRLPALVLSVIFGSKLASREWGIVIAVAVATALLFVLSYLFRDRLRRWPERLLQKLGRGPGHKGPRR